MATLTIPIKREYFEQIRAGLKPEEFRLVTPYWRKRLEGRTYDLIVLTMGYPKADDVARRLARKFGGVCIKTITHPHFGTDPVEVYAIDVSEAA